MKLGLFTPVLGKLTFKEMLAKVGELEKVTAIELGTGGWPGPRADCATYDNAITDARAS